MKPVIFIGLLVLGLSVTAQVKNISKAAEKNASSTRVKSKSGDSGGTETSTEGVIFLLDISIDMLSFIGRTQRGVLDRKSEEPWLVSFSVAGDLGYHFEDQTTLLLPSARLNWGIFSTEIRNSQLFDGTGIYQTTDWQIIQLNLVNQSGGRLYFGYGLSYEKETRLSHNDFATGLNLFFNERKLKPSLEVRWSRDAETRVTPRFEITNTWDVVFRKGKWVDAAVRFGIRHQQYYSQENFTFIFVGLNFELYRHNSNR